MDRRQFLSASLVSALAGAAWPSLALSRGSDPLRVGYFDRYWPFSQRADNGLMSGMLIESLDAIARSANVALSHDGYPWARTQVMVERGELDAFCTVPTQGRMTYALFCKTPVITMDYGFYHRSDDPRPGQVRSLEDLRSLVQGTYRGSGYTTEYLEADRMIFFHDEETVLKRIALGTIDTLVEGEYVGAARVKSLGLEGRLRFTAAPWLPKANFCFGVRRSLGAAETIIKTMEAATLSAGESGELKAIAAKYR